MLLVLQVLQGEYETYLELGTMCLKFNSIKLCRRTFFNQLANSCLVVLRACEERGAQEPSNGVSTRVIRFQLLKRTSSRGSGYFFKLMGQSFWVLSSLFHFIEPLVRCWTRFFSSINLWFPVFLCKILTRSGLEIMSSTTYLPGVQE